MFWLTFRQHRMQVLVTVGVLAVLGVVLLVQGLGTVDAKAELSGTELDRVLEERYELLYQVLTWLPAAPVLIGLFWGAPLLGREAERGTLVLAWTQSVTRRRWVTAKLAWLALAVALCGLALGAMVEAWNATFAGSDFARRFGDRGMFTTTGVVAGGWWLFGFMLGVAGGALFRRLLPAMAVTLAVFFVVLFAVMGLRGDYATPDRIVQEIQESPRLPADDVLLAGSGWLAPDGTETTDGPLPTCEDVPPPTFAGCLRESGYRMVTYVHPADRYWRFQWTEAGLLLAGAVLLAGVSYQRVARWSV
ncbi:ABC transporter permease [Actinophytocola sp.]|uniref:ABC transporter permease n=1 Tax=Actinophytocola sp. TaxID=1872138 RepID=UPI0025C32D08|nr:ABC transporter permease [Actinophytocola sp.]